MIPGPASPGLLFGSFLYRSDLFSQEFLTQFWEEHYGKSFHFIPSKNPLEQYYSKEMGGPLARFFCISSRKYPREYLLSTKLLSLKWEEEWRTSGRGVNVDVGFLSLENFILATTKNYSHRVYLGQNIFADLTYFLQEGKWMTLPWTYPDYQDEEKKEFLLWCRSFLLQTLSN